MLAISPIEEPPTMYYLCDLVINLQACSMCLVWLGWEFGLWSVYSNGLQPWSTYSTHPDSSCPSAISGFISLILDASTFPARKFLIGWRTWRNLWSREMTKESSFQSSSFRQQWRKQNFRLHWREAQKTLIHDGAGVGFHDGRVDLACILLPDLFLWHLQLQYDCPCKRLEPMAQEFF